MPRGGRPSRGRRKDDRLWEHDARVEEIETDEETAQGVELSDELHFDGIDLRGQMGRRRRSGDAYYDDFTPSDDEDDYDAQRSLIRRADMQVAYREKEELLVQRALDRIARARALGKPNVKLSRAEIDALERLELERNQGPQRASAAPKAAAPKSKKAAPVVKRKPVEVRNTSSRSNVRSASDSPIKGKSAESRSRGKSTATNNSARGSRDNSVTGYALPPTDLDYDPRVPYLQGYQTTGVRQADSSRRGSRTNSNQSLRQPSQTMPHYQHPYYTNRYASNPDATYNNRPGSNSSRSSRPDPSEMDWEPRARSTSSLVTMPLDQLPYQTSVVRAPRFDPADPRFASPQKRVASGPPAILQNQAAQYRRPQDELFLPERQPEVYNYLAASNQEVDSDDVDEDSDYDAGVEVVDVSERPGGSYAIQTRSAAAAASSSHRARNTGKGAAGKSKKGR